jgi:phosphatidylglycerophosphate synthase
MSRIKQIREIVQPKTKKVGFLRISVGENWFIAIFARRISIYIAWLFVKLRLTANMVTMLMIMLGIGGASLMVPHILWLNIIGFLLLLSTEVLDAVDGEVARWNKQCSIKGHYLDLVSHILCNSLMYIVCPLHLYLLERQVVYLVLAFVSYAASHSILGLSYAHQIVKLSYGGKSKIQEAGCYEENQSFRKNKIWMFIKAASYSTDMAVIMIVSAICIFLSYADIIMPLVTVAWFTAVSQTLLMVGRILHKYFIQLPDNLDI